MFRQPLSLQARSLLAAGVALAAFLGLTGVALDAAIYETLRTSLRERLESYVYAYLATSEVSRSGRWLPPDVGPDSRFDQPNGNLFAGVLGPVENDDATADHWRSPSAQAGGFPFEKGLNHGEKSFAGPLPTAHGQVYVFSEGISWAIKNRSVDLTFYVAEDASLLDEQRSVFRRSLFVYLGALGVGLLALLLLTLRWSLRPLRRVAEDLTRVEHGERERLSGDYPTELSGLATNLNDFIDSEREHLQRYRNTLADLAHSLKTPLAVLRSQLESTGNPDQLRWTVVEQVGRMDEIVAYQLSRAATSGHTTFAAPIAIGPCAEEVVGSLEKVYASRKVLCEFEVDAAARFYGEQGDLLELLGNLLENAFKWAEKRVLFTARPLEIRGGKRIGVEMIIEDDGPGIPDDKVEHYLQRGVRGDERVQGYGIGLAIVQQLIKAYRGTMQVTKSTTLGGAAFTLRFDPN
jgi:two-component system sensor histidine kinase PhoQ